MNFTMFTRRYNEFCSTELSAFYLDVLKDRLYLPRPDDPARRAAQTVLYSLVETLAPLLAPLLSFTAEEIWQQVPGDGRADSVQLTDWPVVQAAWTDEALAAKWTQVLAVRAEVNVALADARAKRLIAQPPAAKVTIFAAGDIRDILASLAGSLSNIFQVSAVELADFDAAPPQAYRGGLPQVAIDISRAPGDQCERCRQWQPLGADRTRPSLCKHCASLLGSMSMVNRQAA